MLGMGSGFAAGNGPATLHIPGLPPVGVLICYEAIFTGQIVDRDDRPDWLANATNDAWFGNSSGPRQHLTGSRLRAVEEGLPLLRAANTGISAGFDAHREDDLGQLGLVEADYEWITQRIKGVADRHSKGRIVSCLEGGYSLSALARSVAAHLRVLAGV